MRVRRVGRQGRGGIGREAGRTGKGGRRCRVGREIVVRGKEPGESRGGRVEGRRRVGVRREPFRAHDVVATELLEARDEDGLKIGAMDAKLAA